MGVATAPFRTTVRSGDDASLFLARWLRVWVALLAVVTLVVVAYLIVITNRLASINGHLRTANTAVTGAGGNVRTLPQQVNRINGSLDSIDTVLKPIPGQADEIIRNLTDINGKLVDTDSSLKDTNGSLTNTDGSLKDTSSVLQTVLGQVSDVNRTLIDADDPPDKLGVQNIHERVAFINGQNSPRGGPLAPNAGTPGPFGNNPNGLAQARGDAGNILAGLVDVNKHLKDICGNVAVNLVGGPKPC